MVYQDRLLLYADILGWSAAITHGEDGSKLLSAVGDIHENARNYNERAREEMIAADGKVIQTDLGPMLFKIIRTALEVQFGAFSDHFVFSLPAAFGSRVFGIASNLIIRLLRAGFLTRGAVVLGKLHHCDNVIFGPALLKAVAIEEREAFYPRILVSADVVDHCSKLTHDARHKTMIADQTGRLVINPFAMPFDGPDHLIASFAQQSLFFSDIKSIVDGQITHLEDEGRHNHAEKWRYLDQFVAGPVLNASPKLRDFWR
jgi:hypothetical protein